MAEKRSARLESEDERGKDEDILLKASSLVRQRRNIREQSRKREREGGGEKGIKSIDRVRKVACAVLYALLKIGRAHV